jgi:hypothetical protein
VKYGKSELIRRLTDIPRKGWTNAQIRDMIDTLWRDEVPLRTSGFKIAGGTDAELEWNDETMLLKIRPAVKKFAFYIIEGNRVAYIKKYDEEERDLSGNPSLADSGSGSDLIERPEDDSGDGAMEEGWYLVYFDLDPDDKIWKMTWHYNPTVDEERDVYLTKVSVCWIYWDAENLIANYFGDERHGYEWPPQVNWWSYRSFNGILDSGFEMGWFPNDPTGDSNLDSAFGITAGKFWHEDILHEIDAPGVGPQVPIFWFKGTVPYPRRVFNEGYAVWNEPGERLYYNKYFEDTLEYNIEEAYDNNFVLCHMFATNCMLYPIISFLGQGSYVEWADALLAVDDELDFIIEHMPHKEYLYLGGVLFHTSDEYHNDTKAIIVDHWTKEELPEKVAEAVAAKAAPFLKTGWHPDVQKQVVFTWLDYSPVFSVSIRPKGGYANYFVKGEEYQLTSTETKRVILESGMSYLWHNKSDFDVQDDQWDNGTNEFCMVAAVYWNDVMQKAIYVGYEMHNYSIETRTRGILHKEKFTEYIDGLEIVIWPEDQWKIEISDGHIRDEDIEAAISNVDSLLFGQPLWPWQGQKLYLLTDEEGSGSGSGEESSAHWYDDVAVLTNIVKLDGSNEVQINVYDDEDGWTLESTVDDEYTAVWVLATMDFTWPIKILLGTAKGDTADEARENNNIEDLINLIKAAEFCCEEYVLLARIIVKNITDAPYYEIIEIDDFRNEDLPKQANDRYVKEAEFDELTRILRLKRTVDLADLTVEIPCEVFTDKTIIGDGNFDNPVELVNDEDTPGAWEYYGTDANGVKGWHRIGSTPEGSGSESESGSESSGSGEEANPWGVSTVETDMSVTGNGSVEDPVKLINDEEAPGNSEYYGTDEAGVKGYYPLPLSVSREKEFEFCVNAGEAETFNIDIYSTYAYTITKAILETDTGELEAVAVYIDSVAIDGLDDMDVSTVDVWTATANNETSEGSRVTLETSGTDSGTPTIIRGKIVITG